MKTVVIVMAVAVLLIMFACIKTASDCSREEEKQFRERCKARAQQEDKE